MCGITCTISTRRSTRKSYKTLRMEFLLFGKGVLGDNIHAKGEEVSTTAKTEFAVTFVTAMCKRIRQNGKKVPRSVLKQLHCCEQALAEMKDKA